MGPNYKGNFLYLNFFILKISINNFFKIGDFGFLKINGSIPFTDRVSPACFPKNNKRENYRENSTERNLYSIGVGGGLEKRDDIFKQRKNDDFNGNLIQTAINIDNVRELEEELELSKPYYKNLQHTFFEDASSEKYCDDYLICTQYSSNDNYICGGDLGAPLVYEFLKDGKILNKVVGISSFSYIRFIGRYLLTCKYLKFILNFILIIFF